MWPSLSRPQRTDAQAWLRHRGNVSGQRSSALRESMRLYPAAHGMNRSTRDDEILGGYHIPAASCRSAGPVCARTCQHSRGVETDAELPHPGPPHAAIKELVERYLGPIARNRKGPAVGRQCQPRRRGFASSRLLGPSSDRSSRRDRGAHQRPDCGSDLLALYLDSSLVRGTPCSVRSRPSATAG
jgi:hypothetical protein